MAYYQFDDDAGDVPAKAGSIVNATLNWVVRFAGVGVLAVGIWAAVNVINEAWDIYKSPRNSRVDNVALAIDEATHIDTIIAPPARAEAEGADKDKKRTRTSEPFRLSYFIAWPIVLLLLLLIGRLAISAIKAGGELALFDSQFRRFARELLREMGRSKSA